MSSEAATPKLRGGASAPIAVIVEGLIGSGIDRELAKIREAEAAKKAKGVGGE